MNVLFTGFGPFEGVDYNPSWDAAQAAAEVVDAAAELLDVTFDEAAQIATRTAYYDLVVHFGVAATRGDVCLERYAHNWRADIGAAPRRLRDDGPVAFECALPLDAIAAALDGEAGLKWRVSHDAGTYVCNATLYTALQTHGLSSAMFVHIPAVDADVACQVGRALAKHLRQTT